MAFAGVLIVLFAIIYGVIIWKMARYLTFTLAAFGGGWAGSEIVAAVPFLANSVVLELVTVLGFAFIGFVVLACLLAIIRLAASVDTPFGKLLKVLEVAIVCAPVSGVSFVMPAHVIAFVRGDVEAQHLLDSWHVDSISAGIILAIIMAVVAWRTYQSEIASHWDTAETN